MSKKTKKTDYATMVNKAKNLLLAAFVFGSLGAYAGITYMNSQDARTDDRINAVLKANHVIAQPSPVAIAQPSK